MKTITLKEAHQILQDCAAVIINDYTLLYPSLDDLKDDESNEFMYLSWEDEGLKYNLKFCEGDNLVVQISGSSMFLYDTDANDETDHTQLTILDSKNLE